MAGALEGEVFIGQKAQDVRGLLKLRYSLQHGIVTHWDDMERIWNHLYSQEMKISPEEVRIIICFYSRLAVRVLIRNKQHPVLLTEAPLNPRTNRDTAAQIFFETFNVPALFTSIQAVLSLYASGRTTGLVLDSGDGVSHTVPIYEGFAITNGIRRIDLAGRDITEYLNLLIRKSGGAVFHTSAEKEIVRSIKEKLCYLSLDIRKEERDFRKAELSKSTEDYKLPDGNTIKVSHYNRV